MSLLHQPTIDVLVAKVDHRDETFISVLLLDIECHNLPVEPLEQLAASLAVLMVDSVSGASTESKRTRIGRYEARTLSVSPSVTLSICADADRLLFVRSRGRTVSMLCRE